MSKIIDHLGVAEAARILNISPSLLTYRAQTGKVPLAGKRPLRFRLADLLDYQRTMPASKPGRPKSDRLEHIIREVLTP